MKEPNPTIGLRDTKKFPRDNASARSVGELRDLGRNVTGASGSKRATTCSGRRVVT
jgi:hypothetical protein